MRPETAIVGVGATPYYFRGESAPQTLYELIGKAVLAAVADAGLRIEDVDGLAFYAGGFYYAQAEAGCWRGEGCGYGCGAGCLGKGRPNRDRLPQ